MANPGSSTRAPVWSTAGAVPVKNEKGQVSMQKVKVTRYIAGKRPEFAPSDESGSESESDVEFPFGAPGGTRDEGGEHSGGRHRRRDSSGVGTSDEEFRGTGGRSPDNRHTDRRLRRLREREQVSSEDENEKLARHRWVREPEVLPPGADRQSDGEGGRTHRGAMAESSDEDEDLNEQELDNRRAMIRARARARAQQEESLAKESGGEEEGGSEEESEEEEDDESDESDDDDDQGPRLKPVFVRKRDRITLQETEKEELRLKELQLEQKKLADERRKQSVKLVEDAVRREQELEKQKTEDRLNLDAVCTEDENEELAYEQWKLRELKRIKRQKDETESAEKEKQELERIHNMSEEERRNYLRLNPKIVTNKAMKGKYKFLQKYYHRGAFYLEHEDGVYKRDFAQPTLEDHFDKTILPKIMQVKNFGMAGRTKYTHLVDQDTTDFNSAWTTDSSQNMKFFTKHAGGMRDVFDRPSAKKRKPGTATGTK